MGVGDKINSDGIKNLKAKAAEEAIIGLLLLYDEFRDMVISGKAELAGEDFFSDFHRRAFENIISLQKQEQYDFSMLGEYFDPDEMGRLQGLEQKRRMLTENGREVFASCIEALKNEKMVSPTESSDGIDEIKKLLERKRTGR
jgi:hypothetical protein